MPNIASAELGRPPSTERAKPAEKPRPLQSKEISLIAANPTREQLQQLAQARARERDQRESGYDKKDLDWSRRLVQRYERARATHQDVAAATKIARSAARWGNEDNYQTWVDLRAQQNEAQVKLQLLSEPFMASGLTLDESQIPPSLSQRLQENISQKTKAAGETLATPVKKIASGIESAVNTTKSRMEGARKDIVETTSQKLNAIDGARKTFFSRLGQMKSELGSVIGEASKQKRSEIGAFVNSARLSAERTSSQAESAVKLSFARARQKASEITGRYSEMVSRDKEAIRSKAKAASEHVARAVEANTGLTTEVLAAMVQRGSERAGAAFGLPKKGLDSLVEAGGEVVDQFNQKVSAPVAREFRRTREIMKVRAESAKGRLNRIFDLYGDSLGPKFAVVKGATARLDQMGDKTLAAGEKVGKFLRGAGERVSRSYEAVSDMIVSRTTELWGKTEGLTKVDITKRAGLMKARLANVGNLARQAGLKAEEAAVFGITLATMGAERAAALIPESKKGRILAGGILGAGAFALLAATHPDVFGSISDSLSLPGSADAASLTGGADLSHISQAGEQAGQIASNIPASEAVDAVASSGVDSLAGHSASFSEFLNNAVTVNPGDTLWETVKGQTAPFGDWESPTGVHKGDVISDMVRHFMQAAGQNPDLIHPGDVISIGNLDLTQGQLGVLRDALNSTSFTDYQSNVMPRFVSGLG